MQCLIVLSITVHTKHEECVYTQTRVGVPRYCSLQYWVPAWAADLRHASVKSH